MRQSSASIKTGLTVWNFCFILEKIPSIVSPHTTNKKFCFSCKNWRVHAKRPTIVCFSLYNKKWKLFIDKKASVVKKFAYNTCTTLIFHIYLMSYFIISQPKKIETCLIIFCEIIQRIFHCNMSESENLVPTKL